MQLVNVIFLSYAEMTAQGYISFFPLLFSKELSWPGFFHVLGGTGGTFD